MVAALAERAGRILVQQRRPGRARALLWELPGGKVEPGEPEPAALARELAEELGVEARIGGLLWSGAHAYPDLRVELRLYRAWLPASAEPEARDAQAVAWVPRAELAALPFCEADAPLLAPLAAGAFPDEPGAAP